ncbi:MBL fold metallo-hydrolase [Hydrogenophaga sp.]|jgi:glyoxylase-like metal-dependent hydrolase (beta-lactamase superfamily II)|uniref:MBL fold metallo-hydrolase n=2 Tax=Hydrogenophaga sp. TaxID=1904254 RepID=UPI0025B80B22|nr:MBL fold metallo-hydrolase [Hydrogenophaga sp.]MDO9134335.1 MBL fold metallo-hydrolase [Hydrogenophaga sp.]MDO9505907.1 MBL fold metallo-hydrolase [Hydrogenophaga sp.]MDP1782592.1 MBL fold metallo-hydrolase [Hydrogenophaga sp.]MDP2074832.1 MBL fold metallo-hydrolase [Hydrogenophaga sp.]MDP2251705.1 MBL fold metallo-hydrolase [Hydrogenophaga sp.]
MSKAFASQADLDDKKTTFEQLSKHCWAYTAEGDPNSGVIIGEKFIMVSDATATPAMAQDLIKHIRTVSDKPIKYVLLTHYHAVRVLGASAYVAEGATEVIASRGTYELIVERGAQDMQSEMERFPRLFRGADSVPGLTWPTLVIGDGQPGRQGSLEVDLGGVKVSIWHPGPGHTRGDTIAWVEEEKVLFSGDLVEYEAGVYTGDAQLEEWPATLEALRALKAEYIVPGRGEAMKGNADVNKALDYTQRWVTTLFQAGKEAAAAGMDLKTAMAHTRKSMDPVFGHVFIYEHCLPFDVSRAYDEAKGIKNPRIWTAERDQEMWNALQA